MSDALPIADTAASLTADWTTEALRASGRLGAGVRVSEVAVAMIGTGQMSGSARLDLAYDGACDHLPATLVAKLPSSDPTSRATALALGSYENEVRFYQQLAPRLAVRTPEVFYADIDVATASFVLLLEDLSPARAGDQLAGCSVDAAAAAVDELVRLHAPLWGDPELRTLPWLHRDRAAQQLFMQELLPQLWAGFRDRYADRLGDDVHRAGEQLFSRLDEYLLADTEPWTVVHGDYRLDNLMFGPDPTKGQAVTVVDWQTCTHGPAMQDVAYFIGAGFEPDDRQAVEGQLVSAYHAGLAGVGVDDYGWDTCWRDYRRGSWSGLIMAVAASMLVERTERGDDMFMLMAERHSRHALDLAAGDVIAG